MNEDEFQNVTNENILPKKTNNIKFQVMILNQN